MTRPCGCTADPSVFGHTCRSPGMSADAQEARQHTTPGGTA